MPWVPVIDEAGRAQKIPARREWQLTLRGEWQVPDERRLGLNDDPDEIWKYKYGIVPGRGRWKPSWQEGWVCTRRTGLWVIDIDNLVRFRARMEELGIEVPRTYSHSTGREGGGMHMLFDGRDLPEEYWAQGPLGSPCWGDLKAAGFIAATGARHPRGPVYTCLPDSGLVLAKPPLGFAEVIA